MDLCRTMTTAPLNSLEDLLPSIPWTICSAQFLGRFAPPNSLEHLLRSIQTGQRVLPSRPFVFVCVVNED